MQRDEELLGLTEYEGRVYRALLSESPATAYRLGKLSGVPLSRVYEVTDRLVQKGAAGQMGGEPARYVPVPPEVLVAGAKAHLGRRLDELAADLTSTYAAGDGEGHSWLRGQGPVLAAIEQLSAAARTDLQVAAGESAAALVQPVLRSCGPDVRVGSFPLGDSPRETHLLLVLSDAESALIGRTGSAADALLTRHPTIVRLCSEYFRLYAIAHAARVIMGPRPPQPALLDHPTGWLDWEEEKQRRLLIATQ